MTWLVLLVLILLPAPRRTGCIVGKRPPGDPPNNPPPMTRR